MAQSLERLDHRTQSLESIRGIVRTMKAMSAINAQPYERAAHAIDVYRDIVLDGFRAFLHKNGPLTPNTPNDATKVIVVLGTDHGLCGNYNEQLAIKVGQHVAEHGQARIICVGVQLEDALNGERMTPEVTLLPAATTDGFNRLARTLVTRLDGVRGPGDTEVTLIFTRREAHGRQAPVSQRLLPLDSEFLNGLSHRPWASRSLPQFSLPARDLLAVLVRDLLFATLYRATAEAMVTENAARLARMQQAEQSVDERLEELRAETRGVRQSEITTELLDVIVGFEALKKRRYR